MNSSSWILEIRFRILAMCMALVFVTSAIVGVTGHFIYWLLFESFGRRKAREEQKLTWTQTADNDNQYHTIIIGTGFSGIGMAVRLSKMGMNNYILLERNDEVGGTWYVNTYPGCACDVPSNLYSFSFEPNPNWSYYFSRQSEIGKYLKHCADKYGIRKNIRFNNDVNEIRWLDNENCWRVKTKTSTGTSVYYGQSIVLGTGPLSNPTYPTDISGIDDFRGQMCHTATWNPKIDFRNKRVAVIGTGASAIQVVPEIQKMPISKLYVFQRTAPHVIPRIDRPLNQWEKDLFRVCPWLQKIVRMLIYWATESFALTFVYRFPLRFIIQDFVHCNLQRQVKDESMLKRVTPYWEFGCKRMLISNDWYPTLQKSNVELVTGRIKALGENSIVTNEGTEYPVDIIIWSTGFETQKFPLSVHGINGKSLTDEWSQTIQAYRGVTVPNFPNFFVLLGPNTALGHNSVVLMIEAQINYIAEAFLYMNRNNLRSIAVKQTVHEEFNKDLQLKLRRTVWQKGGCKSWYQDAKGNNTSLWPGFTWVYILLMNYFDPQNYILSK